MPEGKLGSFDISGSSCKHPYSYLIYASFCSSTNHNNAISMVTGCCKLPHKLDALKFTGNTLDLVILS